MHVAIDAEDAPLRIGREHVGVSDQVAAPATEILAVGRQFDHARVVRLR
jgi:hypothetical protein